MSISLAATQHASAVRSTEAAARDWILQAADEWQPVERSETVNRQTILVTEPDMAKLERLLRADSAVANSPAGELLREKLQSAKVLTPEQIPDDVVTMNSRVRLQLLDTRRE